MVIPHLDNGFLPADFEDLTATDSTVGKSELDDLVVRGELNDQRASLYEQLTETLSRTTSGL